MRSVRVPMHLAGGVLLSVVDLLDAFPENGFV